MRATLWVFLQAYQFYQLPRLGKLFSIICLSFVLLLPTLASTSKAASVALLPLSAEEIPKRNQRLLEEAIVAALSESVDASALSPNDIDESLNKKQRYTLRECNTAACWLRVIGKLSLTQFLHITVLSERKNYLLSCKLIDISQKRITKRLQLTIEKNPATFAASAQNLISTIFENTQAAKNTLASTTNDTAEKIEASSHTPDFSSEPLLPLPEVLPTVISNVGEYQWTDGVGFTHPLKQPVVADTPPTGGSLVLSMPELVNATFDEGHFSFLGARTTLNPVYNSGDLFATPAQMYELELRHFYEWRAPYWFIAPWIDSRFTLGTAKILREDLKVIMGSLAGRVGCDLHPLPWYQTRPIFAIGGFVGGRYYYNYWKDTAWNEVSQNDDRGTNIDYGISLRLRSFETPEERALLTLTATYFQRRANSINAAYATTDLAITFVPISLNFFIERRISTSGDFTFATPFGELMASQMRIGGGISHVW
ncbi:MAG: hypothetical protein JW841_06705 [Deltaproteobacteria bacterium]|nr:hypothetical protein [Deltaproteobacteria bacterium]